MGKKWNDSSMLQHMYMKYKDIKNEEKLKGYIAKLSLLTGDLGSDFKLCSAIKKSRNSNDYVDVDISLHKVVVDNQVMYYFTNFYIDESTAILLANDFYFVKLVLTCLCINLDFIDYIKDNNSLITNTDTKVYIANYNSSSIIIEVNSDYLMVNSKFKLTFENIPLVFKWMIGQLQRGNIYTDDILLPDSQFVKYLVDSYNMRFCDGIK